MDNPAALVNLGMERNRFGRGRHPRYTAANEPGEGMKRALIVSLMMLTGTSAAAANNFTKAFSYACKNGNFTVTASVDSAGRWSKSEPVLLQVGDEPPQTLTADPDAPEADSYRNKDYEFYSLKTYTTLTQKSHGVTVKYYSACKYE